MFFKKTMREIEENIKLSESVLEHVEKEVAEGNLDTEQAEKAMGGVRERLEGWKKLYRKQKVLSKATIVIVLGLIIYFSSLIIVGSASVYSSIGSLTYIIGNTMLIDMEFREEKRFTPILLLNALSAFMGIVNIATWFVAVFL